MWKCCSGAEFDGYRIGERVPHTQLVLRYLLGTSDVRNYDGSWTEWGNPVRTPIVEL